MARASSICENENILKMWRELHKSKRGSIEWYYQKGTMARASLNQKTEAIVARASRNFSEKISSGGESFTKAGKLIRKDGESFI